MMMMIYVSLRCARVCVSIVSLKEKCRFVSQVGSSQVVASSSSFLFMITLWFHFLLSFSFSLSLSASVSMMVIITYYNNNNNNNNNNKTNNYEPPSVERSKFVQAS